jgi:glycosyltransferase involved in cell wall biosynthesis
LGKEKRPVIKLYDRPVLYYKPEKRERSVKVSIVQAVLNSPEIARRQFLHYEKMNLPDDVEIIIVDDGSEPPLIDFIDLKNLTIYYTGDKRDWTQPAARNFGAKKARGEFCIFTDIDHIISKEVIEIARDCPADVVRFKREAGVLDENGDFTQDRDVLREWGFREGGLRLAPHSNSFIIRTGLYLGLGGVSERYVGSGKHPNREEVPFKSKLKPLEKQGKITIWQDQTKPMIYMMPNGRYCGHKDANPFGFFHNLERKNR